MAIPFQLTFTVRDADGDTTDVTCHFPSTLTDVTARELVMNSFVGSIDDLIHGVITNVSYAIPLSPAGLKTSVAGQADMLVGGRFLMQSAEGFKKRLTLPTFDTANNVLVGQSDINNTTAVNALKTILEGGNIATIADAPITDVYEQYETFGGKRS